MKLLSKTIIFCSTIVTLIAQNVNLDLRYEQAIKLTNADDALKIYEEIISSNLESDYVWLSKLKKAEMYYARGSYITSSNILNANYLVQGSIRKGGNKVRIYAKLTDALNDVQIWSQTWDRSLDDVFEVQDEVSQKVSALALPAIILNEQNSLDKKE